MRDGSCGMGLKARPERMGYKPNPYFPLSRV